MTIDIDDDEESAEVFADWQIRQRIEGLVNAALSLIDCDAVEAECWAYEAGRYAWELDGETPSRLAPYPALSEAFARGRLDVQALFNIHGGAATPEESKRSSRPGV